MKITIETVTHGSTVDEQLRAVESVTVKMTTDDRFNGIAVLGQEKLALEVGKTVLAALLASTAAATVGPVTVHHEVEILPATAMPAAGA